MAHECAGNHVAPRGLRSCGTQRTSPGCASAPPGRVLLSQGARASALLARDECVVAALGQTGRWPGFGWPGESGPSLSDVPPGSILSAQAPLRAGLSQPCHKGKNSPWLPPARAPRGKGGGQSRPLSVWACSTSSRGTAASSARRGTGTLSGRWRPEAGVVRSSRTRGSF